MGACTRERRTRYSALLAQQARSTVAALSSPFSRLLSSPFSLLLSSPADTHIRPCRLTRHSVKPSADSPSRRACSGRASSSSGVTLRSGSRSSASRRPSVRKLSVAAPRTFGPHPCRVPAPARPQSCADPRPASTPRSLARSLARPLTLPMTLSMRPCTLKPLCLQTPTPSGR